MNTCVRIRMDMDIDVEAFLFDVTTTIWPTVSHSLTPPITALIHRPACNHSRQSWGISRMYVWFLARRGSPGVHVALRCVIICCHNRSTNLGCVFAHEEKNSILR